jgi:hypothetical protein
LKKIVAIGLLVLLLYNMMGLTTAILFFDNEFKSASFSGDQSDLHLLKVYLPSLPYSTDWENAQGFEGLTKSNGNFYNATHVLHANDTLYVTLQTNQTARDRFFDLASQMQSITDPGDHTPDSQQGKALKLLDNLLKNYVQNIHHFSIPNQSLDASKAMAVYSFQNIRLTGFLLKLPTPPPEYC